MIGISKLYLGTVEPSDLLRYGRKSKKLPSRFLQFSSEKKPVIVWSSTQKCNLKCVHCYARATAKNCENELSTDEAKKMMEDLASYGAPVLIFSGGEPLMRKDFFELATYAEKLGMRTVISTNGGALKALLKWRLQE